MEGFILKKTISSKKKGNSFLKDTKQIVLPSRMAAGAETVSMIFQMIIYSLIFLGIDLGISQILKLFY